MSEPRPVVRLYAQVGLALIVEHPTGVVYVNQAGRVMCLQPSAEGFVVPIGNDVSDDMRLLSVWPRLAAHWTGPVRSSEGAGRGLMAGLTDVDADVLDSVLADDAALANLRVDRTRLEEAFEAWLPVVVVEASRFDAFDNLRRFPAKGILVWPNSD